MAVSSVQETDSDLTILSTAAQMEPQATENHSKQIWNSLAGPDRRGSM